MTPARFAPALLAWYQHHGRHDLPWQKTRSAYRVWVSEIMLQQTQVATVIPYYQRFIARFPDIQALAAAPIDEVLHLWSGLGYYARARNLRRAAEILVTRHGGTLPDTLDALTDLPGIGRSTAGAILALAYGQRQPILDGNVKRVLARWFAIAGWPGQGAVREQLWQASELVTPTDGVGDYTQAIMDLGATLCVRGQPQCAKCPVAPGCVAHLNGTQGQFPGRRSARLRRRRRRVCWLVAVGPGGFYLVQRPSHGVWGGLWGFPEFGDAAAALAYATENFTLSGGARAAAVIDHSFTHFDLAISPLYVPVATGAARVQDTGAVWYNPNRPLALGLAAPVTQLVCEPLASILNSVTIQP